MNKNVTFISLDKFKSRFPKLSSFIFIFTLVLLGYIFYEFSRYGGLPKHTKPGLYNDLFISFTLIAILIFSFRFQRIGKYIFSFILFLTVLLTISNWWYFSFYRDYISVESLKLFLYVKETALNIPGLPYKAEAGLFVTSLLTFSYFVFKLKPLKPSNKSLSIITTVFLSLAIVNLFKFSAYELGGGIHSGVHPLGFLVYDKFLKKDIESIGLTEKHITSLKKLYPERQIGELSEEFPLMKFTNYENKNEKTKKNVLIVVMESVRAAEMGVYGAKSSISPNLDQISRESSTIFNNAYANSFQTSRGELAILCSAYDYIRGAPYSESNNIHLTKCLPEILKENDYSTFWFHGYDKKFFNRRNFLPSIGIDNIHDRKILKENGYDRELGWGVPDHDLFDYTLSVLEKQNSPFFAEVLTLSNHYPYQWNWDIDFPKELEINNSNKDDIYHAYKRGMYFTDNAIGKFWKKFKKSSLYDETIVVFTSDHGIWIFDEELNKNHKANETFVKKDKYFRIPLIVYSPDSKPSTNEDLVSQVDIAPSILGMLNLNSVNAFVGRDLFSNTQSSMDPWVVSVGSGGYSFRQNDTYCHPHSSSIDKECKDRKAYLKCDLKTSDVYQYVCGKTEENFLSGENPSITSIPTPNTFENIKALMEYAQYSLKHGLMPQENKTPQKLSSRVQ